MKTTTHTTMLIMPYTDEQKLHLMEEHLSKIIKDETEDYARTVGIISRFNRWYPKHISRFLRKTRITLYQGLEYVKNQFESSVTIYGKAKKEYRELTSIEGKDTILKIDRQRSHLFKEADLQQAYSDVAQIHLEGNSAKSNILLSNAYVNVDEGEYLKSEDYLDQIRQKDAEAINYPKPFQVHEKPVAKEAVEQHPKKTVQPPVVEQAVDSPSTETTNSEAISPIKTHKGIAPDYYVAEQQLHETMEAYGQSYADKHQDPTIDKVKDETLSIDAKEVIKDADYQRNILGYVTLDKLIWSYGVYGIAVTGEMLIFSSILGKIYNFSGLKAIIAGGSALLISFVIGFSIYGIVLKFIKHNNKMAVRLCKPSRMFLIAMIVSLLYTACMGVLYFNSLNMDDYNSELTMLTQEQYLIDADELNDDMSKDERDAILREKGTKIGEIQKKISESKSGPMAILTAITISLSSSIFMFLSGILFAIVLLFSAAFKRKQHLKNLEKKLVAYQSEFYSRQQQIITANELGLRIKNHIGQRQFIRQLLAGGSPKEIIFEPQVAVKHNGQSSSTIVTPVTITQQV